MVTSTGIGSRASPCGSTSFSQRSPGKRASAVKAGCRGSTGVANASHRDETLFEGPSNGLCTTSKASMARTGPAVDRHSSTGPPGEDDVAHRSTPALGNLGSVVCAASSSSYHGRAVGVITRRQAGPRAIPSMARVSLGGACPANAADRTG